uniref:Uncharacterized protein n=1 Tax=Arundo donax TaxID=35708 RepID=A0A0A8ZT62_ARUDO
MNCRKTYAQMSSSCGRQ